MTPLFGTAPYSAVAGGYNKFKLISGGNYISCWADGNAPTPVLTF